jgi:transposase-like protein
VQHFLLSPAARSLSIAQVLRLTDEEAFGVLQRVRFGDNDGAPFCPHCGVLKVYTLAETPIRWKCSGCRRKFSVTSGTIFHSRKLSIRDHLAVIALFVNGVKGVSALQMSRNMNVGPKSIFVMLHKLRESMGSTLDDGSELAGEVEVDGAYFGSRIRPANRRADRRQQRTDDNRRRVVVVARERQGRAIPWVVAREGAAVPMIRQHVASGTTVHADESGEWNILHASYPMKRVNHSVEFKGEDGGCTNQAESYFSRLRRAEFGVHHRISGHRLQAYADEMAWRENHRRRSNGDHWNLVAAAALAHPKSTVWAGYWHPKKAEA